jgi:predicted aconitase
MRLTEEEQAMLAGDLGPGVRKAMEILVALGTIYGAEDLVPVTSVQVAGVSYQNLGEAGLEFLADWAAQGATTRVPTTLNPAGLDLERWQELGFDPAFAGRQAQVIQAFAAMGIRTTCTCTPYLVGNLPARGDHVAWSESSAVSFANSVLGARTNREGGPSALAAAIAGCTPRYGLHLADNRRAQLILDVRCPVETGADLGALGTMVGQLARNRVPYFRGLASQLATPRDSLKALGAAMAASGAVALYHVEGVTPEADDPDIIAPKADTFAIESLAEGYAALNTAASSSPTAPGVLKKGKGEKIDLVWIGCPHASLDELAQVIELLAGRRVRAALWVTMAREVRAQAEKAGMVAAMEAHGGQVVADTCLVVAPVKELGFRRIATPSGKGAYYALGHPGLAVHYGPLKACIEAAVTGKWKWV